MKFEALSDISIIDGRYAEGKRIHVYPKTDKGADIVLRGLEFLSEIRQPDEKIILQCRSGLTEKGELTICEVSLTRDFANC